VGAVSEEAAHLRRLLRAFTPIGVAGAALLAIALGADPGVAATAAPVRRVVLVTLEGARAGLEHAESMPALRSLAAGGIAFTQARTPSLRAFPATVALFAGRAPAHTGVIDEWSRGAPAEGAWLPEALARAGFRGLALPADPLFHAGTGLGRSFTRFAPRSPAFPESTRVDSALAWLRAPGRRFVWLAIAFGPRPESWRRDDGSGWAESDYARRSAEVDAALSRLARGISALESDGAIVVAIAGTHGVPLTREDAFGRDLRDFEVPLVFRGVAGGSWRPADTPVSLLDVAPTLLELTGARTSGFEGRSLRAAQDRAKPAAAPRVVDLPAEDAHAADCRVSMRDWLRRPRAHYDSTTLARARALRAGCPESPRHAIEEAVALSLGGIENEAAQLFIDAAKRFPGDYRIALAYSDHLIRSRRFEMVVTALGVIPEQSPLAAPAAWREALAAAAQLDFPGAHKAIERAVALAVPPEWADAERAVTKLETSKAVSERTPGDVDARLQYGHALADFGLMEEAFTQFHQARLLDTTRVEADLAIARYLERDQRLPQAIRTLERGLKKDPNHRGIRLALAEDLAASGDARAAIPHFERVLEQDGADARSHYNLACLYARTGETRRALTELERALDNGYRDWSLIETDPDLETVRRLPEFTRLAERRPTPR